MTRIESSRLPLLLPRTRQVLPEITVEAVAEPVVDLQGPSPQAIYPKPLAAENQLVAASAATETAIIHSRFVQSTPMNPRINDYAAIYEFSPHTRSWSA